MKVLWRAARWLLLGLVLLAALLLLPFALDEGLRVAATLTRANPFFLALGLAAVVAWVLAFGILIRESGVVVGRRLPLGRSALLAGALQFVTAFPAGSVAGLVYETRAVERMGVPRATAMLIVGLETVVYYGTFLVYFLLGVFLLALGRDASRSLVLGAAALVVLVAGVAIGALYVLGDPIRAENAHARMQRVFGRGRGVGRSVDEVALAVQRIRETPSILGKPVASSLTMWAALVLTLALVLLAFGRVPNPAIVLTAVGVGFFASRVTPIPGGIGAVEGAVTATLTGFDVPFGEALTIALAYRVLTFLVPAVVGFGAHHFLARLVDPDLDAVVPVKPGAPEAE